jgi:hypothetical protein
MARTSSQQNRAGFVVSAARGFASAGVRMRPTLWRGRCYQWNGSVGPCRRRRRHCSENARVARVSRRTPLPGQIAAMSKRHGTTRSRI